MNDYTFVAENASGNLLSEKIIRSESQAQAKKSFWESLDDHSKDNCASIECVEVVKIEKEQQ